MPDLDLPAIRARRATACERSSNPDEFFAAVQTMAVDDIPALLAVAEDHARLTAEHQALAGRLRDVTAERDLTAHERDVWREQARVALRRETRVLDLCDGEEAGADRLGHPTPRWVAAVREAFLADTEPDPSTESAAVRLPDASDPAPGTTALGP